jgi:hypothetical protein
MHLPGRRTTCRRFAPRLALLLILLPAAAFAANGVPNLNRVVVVVMENKPYNLARVQPYTASLITQGSSFSLSFAATHPSQPNYFALFAGGTLGVSSDACPAPGSPFSAENLGHACEAAGLTWRAYSENLPSAGGTACSYDGSASTGLYTRKHDPWTYFSNLDHQRERPYSDLAADIANNTLPNLVFIIPNNCHNSHNSSTPGCTIADADTWLSNNLPAVINALGPNGVLILTWDEDDSSSGNKILTVFVGPLVIPNYLSSRFITHFTVVRTITDGLGLPAMNTSAAEAPITDIWVNVVPTRAAGWGRIRTLYR